MPVCEGCGGHVSEQFARVFGNGAVHRCLNCDSRPRIEKGSAAGQAVDRIDPLDDRSKFGGYDHEPEIRTDGGTESSERERLLPANRWESKAEENVEEWGLQDMGTLLLATQEELGELTQVFLEYNHEDGDGARMWTELDDLAALMFQLQWAVFEEVRA